MVTILTLLLHGNRKKRKRDVNKIPHAYIILSGVVFSRFNIVMKISLLSSKRREIFIPILTLKIQGNKKRREKLMQRI